MSTLRDARNSSHLRHVSREAAPELSGVVPQPHFEIGVAPDTHRPTPAGAPPKTSAARHDALHRPDLAHVPSGGHLWGPYPAHAEGGAGGSTEETWIVSHLGAAGEWFHESTIFVTPQWSTTPVHRPGAAGAASGQPILEMRIDGAASRALGRESTNRPHAVAQPQSRPRAIEAPVVTAIPRADRTHDEVALPAADEPTEKPHTESPPNAQDDLPVAWEVDQFPWPADCEKLYRMLGDELLETAQQLRTAVAQGHRVMGITGLQRGEGRTTVAMLLARAAAHTGLRTVLIEADLENIRMAQLLGIEMPFDWRAAPGHQSSYDETAVYSIHDQLVIVPLVARQPMPPEPIEGSVWHQLIRQWALRAFDLVLVDLGRWPTASEWLPWDKAASLQAAIVVRDLRNSSRSDLEQLIQLLINEGIESVGIIENFARADSA